jgi:FdhD protein
MEPFTRTVKLERWTNGTPELLEDEVATEAPLEIRIGYGPPNARQQRTLAVTMRTPGHDRELALGFAYAEGVVRWPAPSGADWIEVHEAPGRIRIDLDPSAPEPATRVERSYAIHAACGVCGRSSLEGLPLEPRHASSHRRLIAPSLLNSLGEELRSRQAAFALTGGLHGAAIFDLRGCLLAAREDVGRHNAVDKIVGHCLEQRVDCHDKILLVSSRASFELVQKALAAGFPMLAAIGAPSTLAVETADAGDLTLVAFLKKDRFNVYAGAWRLQGKPG